MGHTLLWNAIILFTNWSKMVHEIKTLSENTETSQDIGHNLNVFFHSIRIHWSRHFKSVYLKMSSNPTYPHWQYSQYHQSQIAIASYNTVPWVIWVTPCQRMQSSYSPTGQRWYMRLRPYCENIHKHLKISGIISMFSFHNDS